MFLIMFSWLPSTTNGKPTTNDFRVARDDENDLLATEECKSEKSDNLKPISVVKDSSKQTLDTSDEQNIRNDDRDLPLESVPIHERERPDTHLNEKDLSRERSSINDSSVLPDHPSTWPQRPLLVRPTKDSSTKIIGMVSFIVLKFRFS